MDGNNCRGGGQVPMGQPQGGAVEHSALSSSGGALSIDPDDWSAQQLPMDSRQRIVSKMTETLKKYFPLCGQEQVGLQEIKKLAVGIEERIYSSATSPSDYLRKISLKMLTMETNSQSPTANFLQTDASRTSSDLGNKKIRSESAIDFMDGNNWRGSQVPMGQPQGGAVEQSALSSSDGAPPMDPDDWRAQLPLDSRHRTETLKKQFPISGQEQEGLQEIKKIVVGFEEKISKIYSDATSQSDYLREIPLKMRIMDTKSQSPTVKALQTNDANASRNSSDLGKKRMRSESDIGFIDGNNWRGAQVPMGQPQGGTVKQSALSSSGGTPPMDPNDWRAQLPPDARHRIINKIMETLKKHLPFPGQEQERLQEIKKIAVGFEEKIYSGATSQSDYLRKISLKMLTMETRSQSPMLAEIFLN